MRTGEKLTQDQIKKQKNPFVFKIRVASKWSSNFSKVSFNKFLSQFSAEKAILKEQQQYYFVIALLVQC